MTWNAVYVFPVPVAITINTRSSPLAMEFELFVRMPPHTEPFRESLTKHRRFVNWAQDNRFLVTEVEGVLGGKGTSEFKADADCHLAESTFEIVERAHPEAVILVTEDGDFAPLASALRRRGIHEPVQSMLCSNRSCVSPTHPRTIAVRS